MVDDMTAKPSTRQGFEERAMMMASENYAPEVARSFGYIEYIIDNAFKNRVIAIQVVKEIEDVLEEIKKGLQTDKPMTCSELLEIME